MSSQDFLRVMDEKVTSSGKDGYKHTGGPRRKLNSALCHYAPTIKMGDGFIVCVTVNGSS
jgi:hypothetical protein